ncbi:hypothetical protein AB0M54_45970 [Actinoplanes sp. NPDC051470]|uniref:hypothetical protein n=1 Tax=Actinoplanes sp. NPDC051470 TaxID=3157224 RepID=UPI00343E339E
MTTGMTMVNVNTLLGTVAGVVALVALIAVAVVRWRSTSDEETSRLWKGEAEAQKARADRLESGLADLTRRMTALEEENRVLRSLYDSREEMAQLRHAMTDGFTTLASLLKEGRSTP